jgi:hypothetical protein
MREVSTPTASFLLTGHGCFTLRAEYLHCSIMLILRSCWQIVGSSTVLVCTLAADCLREDCERNYNSDGRYQPAG